MCRFIAYLGQPILMDEILFRPKNSLINQSICALETDEPLNGDGFGVGWYAHDIHSTPAVFTSIHPAWNDHNLTSIAPKIRSHCIFAHVRSANMGGVSIYNCHPFHYEDFLFMHNGLIGEFHKIKRPLIELLSDKHFHHIKGLTDSEHVSALFFDLFERNNGKKTVQEYSSVLRETLNIVESLMEKHGVQEESFLNITLTDGQETLAIRHTTSTQSPARSLYYSAGDSFTYRDGACRMSPAQGNSNRATLIASEKLTSYQADWQAVAENQLLMIDKNLKITVEDL